MSCVGLLLPAGDGDILERTTTLLLSPSKQVTERTASCKYHARLRSLFICVALDNTVTAPDFGGGRSRRKTIVAHEVRIMACCTASTVLFRHML